MTRILNFGSINIDHVYHVPHIVREGETLSSSGLEVFPGGKGLNQSVALAKAGANVFHAGKVGADGENMVDILNGFGVDTRYIQKTNGQTGKAIIQVDRQGRNSIILYPGTNHGIGQEQIQEVFSDFGRGDVLLVQNELKVLSELIFEAKKRDMLIALNPSPIGDELKSISLKDIHWLLLNEIEACELTGKEDPQNALKELSEKYPDTAVVLTLGKDGVIYSYMGKTISRGIYEVPVVDTTAAGDTFTGYFLACILKGMDEEKSLKIATLASSVAVSRAGASSSIPELSEVLQAEVKMVK